MKTIKLFLTAMAFFVFASGYATEFPKMKVTGVSPDKALVTFESPSPTPLQITISNIEGDILYFKRINKRQTQYQELFDFSELGNGTYNICYNYGNRSVNRRVIVSKKNMEVGSPERFYEPYFSLTNNKLNVSFFNASGKQVWFNIYHNKNHVSGRSLGNELAIQKSFDLSELKSGEYKVVVSDSFKDHVYIVSK
jgi:hypothetical protein